MDFTKLQIRRSDSPSQKKKRFFFNSQEQQKKRKVVAKKEGKPTPGTVASTIHRLHTRGSLRFLPHFKKTIIKLFFRLTMIRLGELNKKK
jgi:hypothetical protein